MKTLNIGDEILIEQAWEDEDGEYHDEYAKVEVIRPDGTMILRFENEKVNEFLKDAEYNVNDYLKF